MVAGVERALAQAGRRDPIFGGGSTSQIKKAVFHEHRKHNGRLRSSVRLASSGLRTRVNADDGLRPV